MLALAGIRTGPGAHRVSFLLPRQPVEAPPDRSDFKPATTPGESFIAYLNMLTKSVEMNFTIKLHYII
jgi:hypothetical protein